MKLVIKNVTLARIYGSREARWMSLDPLASKYPSISPYAFVGNSPNAHIDPDGKKIKGVTKDDANKFIQDANTVFEHERFKDFRPLIQVNKSGKVLEKISKEQLSPILSNEKLSEDDKLLINIFVGAVNSKKDFTVEYVNLKDNKVSQTGQDAYFEFYPKNPNEAYNTGVKKAEYVQTLGKHGYNIPNSYGSHSYILEDVEHPTSRAVTTFHEVLGHGSAAAMGFPNAFPKDGKDDPSGNLKNQNNAVQVENLTNRVMGNDDKQIDGSTHHSQFDQAKSAPSIMPK